VIAHQDTVTLAMNEHPEAVEAPEVDHRSEMLRDGSGLGRSYVINPPAK
jgi:hypothetical protein